MKNKKLNKLLIIILLLSMLTSLFVFADVDSKVYDKPQNIDSLAHVYDNGDGTYSYIIATNKNIGVLNWKTGEYIPPEDGKRYFDVNIEFDTTLIDIKTINTFASVGSKTKSAVQKDSVITWTVDAGLKPEKNVLNTFMPFWPRQSIEIVFTPKSNTFGELTPIKSINYTWTLSGENGEESIYQDIFISGIKVDPTPNVDIDLVCYTDESMTKVAKEVKYGERIYAVYTMTNKSGHTVDELIFNSSETLNQAMLNGEKYDSLNADTDYSVKQAVSSGQVITASGYVTAMSPNLEMTLSATATVNVNLIDSSLVDENILGSGEYKALLNKAEIKDHKTEPVFIKHPYYGYVDEEQTPNYKTAFQFVENHKVNGIKSAKTSVNGTLPILYKVTFMSDNNGSVNDNPLYVKGGTILGQNDVPKSIPNQGYQFDLWTEANPINYTITEDTVFTAHHSINPDDKIMYTVKYFKDNVDLNQDYTNTIHVTSQGAIIVPSKMPEGYQLNEDKSSEIPNSITTSGSIILQYYDKDPSQWATVTFAAKDGGTLVLNDNSFNTSSNEVLIGSSLSAIGIPTPQAEDGYKFVGWDKQFINKVTEDVTYMAIFDKNKIITTPSKTESSAVNRINIPIVNLTKQDTTIINNDTTPLGNAEIPSNNLDSKIMIQDSINIEANTEKLAADNMNGIELDIVVPLGGAQLPKTSESFPRQLLIIGCGLIMVGLKINKK